MSGLKKSPLVTSTDDLLNLAEQPVNLQEKPDLSNYKNDVLSFITALNIEPGTVRVNLNTLYLIYKAWSDKPVARKSFTREVGMVLPYIRKETSVYINQNSIKLTHEAYTKYKKDSYVLTSAKYADKFNDFLKYHAIESGDYYMEVDFLYLIYLKYAESKKIHTPFSLISFEKYCRVHFLSKQLLTGPAFGVKPNVENFFEKGELKKLRRNHAKKKKRNKKK